MADAAPSSPPDPPADVRLATRDLLTVVALVVGSLVLPGVGWLIGVALLWSSATWRVSEKLVGTLVWPGGLLVPLALPLLPVGSELLRSPALALTVISVLVLAPMVMGGWLLLRARRRVAAGQLTPPRSP